MPNPVPGDFHRDSFLTNILAGYRMPGLIANQIYPEVPVGKQSDAFPTIERAQWWKVPDTLRAPGAEPKRASYTVGSDQFVCRNYELQHDVWFESVANADVPHAPLQRGGEFLKDQLDLDYEVRVRNKCMSSVGSSLARTGAQAWDNFGGSAPMDDIDIATEAIRGGTGVSPNRAVMSAKLWKKLRRHPDIVQLVNPIGVGGMVSLAAFADLLGVERVLVGQSIQNVGEEGGAAVFRDVWSTNLLLYYVTPTPGIQVPTYGYTFTWRGPEIGTGAPGAYQIMTRRNSSRKVVEMQTGYYSDEKTVFGELAFRIDTGVV